MTGPRLTAEALQQFLDATEPGSGATVTVVTPLAGGYSRDTAVAEVTWPHGVERFVLRSDPPPSVFMSDRASEWALLHALGSTSGRVRIAPPRWFDANGEHFGTRCIVSDFFPSRSLQDISRDNEQDLTDVRNQFVDIMLDIHATPLSDLPADLPRPPAWEDYIGGLLEMVDELSRGGRDSRPALRYAAARLRTYRPPEVPLTLVHGDCQPSNVLLCDDGLRVIDWEFGRIGDPREDLGYYSQIPVPPNLYQDDPAAFLQRYRDGSGLTEEQVNPEVIDFFYLLGLIRLYGQMLAAADAVADGKHRGVMATYLINGVSNQYGTYFRIARRLADAAEAAGRRSLASSSRGGGSR